MGKREYLIVGLKKFIKNVSRDFAVEKFLLFGSRATDRFREDSDVDLIIVSDDFQGMNFFERIKKMYDYWELDLPVDFVCYTNKEFNELKNRISLVAIALKRGILIK